jgi:16S rRNA (uracil1498-N3)-methyltransferase
MLRRIHVAEVRAGSLQLDAAEAHHIRDVLRLTAGTEVEVFDDAGASGRGIIATADAAGVIVRVDSIDEHADRALELTVAAAVPKGDRADWMVEKLSELGVSEFIPLAAERSVVLPRGVGKHQRWERIATEAAKQSRRRGVMRIAELTQVASTLQAVGSSAWFLSTAPDAAPIASLMTGMEQLPRLTLFIGPEGGWAADELELFEKSALTPVALTATILRVETAAIAAAAIVMAMSRGAGKIQ